MKSKFNFNIAIAVMFMCVVVLPGCGDDEEPATPKAIVSQDHEGIKYTKDDVGIITNYGYGVRCIAIDAQGNKGIGIGFSNIICVLDGYILSHHYTPENSGLVDGDIECITIDKQGNKGIGTDDGVSVFDGANGKSYNHPELSTPGPQYSSFGVRDVAIDAQNKVGMVGSNGLGSLTGSTGTAYGTKSGMLDGNCFCITIDAQGNKGIAEGGGISVFDGLTFTNYTTKNSGLQQNNGVILDITIDAQGNKGIVPNDDGINVFDGSTGVHYTSENSGLINNNVNCITIDAQGNKWIGTDGGLCMFDGTNWTHYPTGEQYGMIQCIAIDAQGDKWVGTHTYGNDPNFCGLRVLKTK